MKLFVSPHNDDAVLFGSFTLLREKPTVLTVFDSYIQVASGCTACDSVTRRKEDLAAVTGILGCPLEFGAVRDDESPEQIRTAVRNCLARWVDAKEIWMPAIERTGHEHHNLVSQIGLEIFKGRTIHRYMTYTHAEKSFGALVPFEPEWPLLKLRALACYETQIVQPVGCTVFFLRDQFEYVQVGLGTLLKLRLTSLLYRLWRRSGIRATGRKLSRRLVGLVGFRKRLIQP